MSPADDDPTGALARARLRQLHRDRCVPDPTRPGSQKRVNPEPECPHGTPGGHDNWGCQCQAVRPWHLLTARHPPAWLRLPPRPGELPGCEPEAVAAVEVRRRTRRGGRLE